MAHSLSAKKRDRQNVKRAAMNKARRTRLRTQLKKVKDAVIHHDAGSAETALKDVVKLIDREATRGLVHRNAAARTKSRLIKRIRSLKASAKPA